MKYLFCFIGLLSFATPAYPQSSTAYTSGNIYVPESSMRIPQPLLAGRMHEAHAFTNVEVFKPTGPGTPNGPGDQGANNIYAETPAAIACIYNLVPRTDGCDPRKVRVNSSGGSGVVVIVDAYDAKNIENDLKVFSERFGLPAPNLEVVSMRGARRPNPPGKEGWEIEISLDVEWVHAIAPNAKIILVEAASESYDDMFAAIEKANDLISKNGGKGEVSLSWGGAEFPGQLIFDQKLNHPGVVYFASSGDEPGVTYPASSPNVVAVGGTSIMRDAAGAFVGEAPWENEGAGPSLFESRPSWQNSQIPVVGNKRGTVDIAAVANPRTGVWVYDSANTDFNSNKGWLIVGGTSASAPIVAAIANKAGKFSSSAKDQLQRMYDNPGNFTDLKTGSCGPIGSYQAVPGYDFCSGLGTPNGTSGF